VCTLTFIISVFIRKYTIRDTESKFYIRIYKERYATDYARAQERFAKASRVRSCVPNGLASDYGQRGIRNKMKVE
jgi:hypothetical protein